MVNLRGQLSPTRLAKRPDDPAQLLERLPTSIDQLVSWFRNKERALVLTGAGISTEAGIPDYRGHNGSYYSGHKPMVHDQFMSSHCQRQRYWGRGMVGWKHMETRRPTTGHEALAALERLGKIGVEFTDRPEFYCDDDDYLYRPSSARSVSVITQNVDGLHRRAGTWHSIDLHGRLDEVVCMSCGMKSERSTFQDELENLNGEWLERIQSMGNIQQRADGDVEGATDYAAIEIPPCAGCQNGVLKPNVVFFGDSVPKHRARQCEAAVDACDGLLVVGSSLSVHSAFRHVRSLAKRGTDIAVLNVGETRAETEGIRVLKVEAPVGPTLEGVLDALSQ